jgi:hypothetical protein
MDDGRLLGARLDGGVQIRPPNYEKFVERVVIVPYYKERAYWDFLKAQIGKPTTSRPLFHLLSIETGALLSACRIGNLAGIIDCGIFMNPLFAVRRFGTYELFASVVVGRDARSFCRLQLSSRPPKSSCMALLRAAG